MWFFKKKKIGPEKNTLAMMVFCVFLSIFFFASSFIQHSKLEDLYKQDAQMHAKMAKIESEFISDEKYINKIQKAVFPIFIEQSTSIISKDKLQSIGTGFIIHTTKKLAVTAKHVVNDVNAEYFGILSNGERIKLEVQEGVNDSDIALMQIKSIDSIPSYSLLLSKKQAETNSKVSAFGTSLGSYFQNGKILNTLGSIEADGKDQNNLLTLDIAMNPGDSGAPVVNDSGEVIGIIVAVGMKESGKSLAISAHSMNQLFNL